MEIISEPNVIGVAFTGIFGFILLSYLLFEMIFYGHLRILFSHKALINIGLEKRIRKSFPPWWKITNIYQLSGINRPPYKSRVWVEIESEYNYYDGFFNKASDALFNKASGWVELDRLGRVEKVFDFSYKDELIPDSFKKKWRRDKLLSDLNIK